MIIVFRALLSHVLGPNVQTYLLKGSEINIGPQLFDRLCSTMKICRSLKLDCK